MFNLNFRGTWMSVNKDEQNARIIPDMSNRHMIKWLARWRAFDIIWNKANEQWGKRFPSFWKVLSIMWIQQHPQMQWMRLLRSGSKERVRQYSFIGNALLLAGICKARGRTCRRSCDCVICHCLMRPIKVLAKILLLHIRTTLKDFK